MHVQPAYSELLSIATLQRLAVHDIRVGEWAPSTGCWSRTGRTLDIRWSWTKNTILRLKSLTKDCKLNQGHALATKFAGFSYRYNAIISKSNAKCTSRLVV